MEDLPQEILAVLALLLVLAVPCMLFGLWWLRKKQAQRRAAEAMRRGNQIYGEWRKNTGRQSLD
jgi:hypothetical protein